ncbi:hypothetical protein EAI_16870 [Harpegnathos saltator]|uniref:Uncharacterized protein n=1 Tax=Harpegnathos saltator TaxID=610380 RepID=E2BP36_HARSA|nr:hypothetical protein EAI_16870 [Harpegnathos saltator]
MLFVSDLTKFVAARWVWLPESAVLLDASAESEDPIRVEQGQLEVNLLIS